MLDQHAAEPAMPPADGPILQLDRVRKSFRGITVLDARDFAIAPGRVYGLLGANGSGKSTLVKVLSGFHHPDAGSAGTLRGQPIRWPLRLAHSGVAVVPQEQALCSEVSITENFIAVRRRARPMFGRIDWRAEKLKARQSLDLVGLDKPPDTEVSELSAAERALAAIARSLEEVSATRIEHPILILDEPTANLAPREVHKVLQVVRVLANGGTSVILVNHRMAEIREYCDEVYVLRDGRIALRSELAAADDSALVHAMFGSTVSVIGRTAQGSHAAPAEDREFFTLNRPDADEPGFSLSVAAGEVIGVTGLVGMAQDLLPYQIVGSLPRAGLTVTLDGVTVGPHPAAIRAAGIVVMPADRARHAMWTGGTVTENFTIASLPRNRRLPWLLSPRSGRETTSEMVRSWNVVAPGVSAEIKTLSGGNQQKVIMARAAAMPGWSVLLVHEPTQGVDIAARAELLSRLRSMVGNERAILVFGSDYEAIAEACDRVMVLRHGLPAVVLSGDEISEPALAHAAMSADGSYRLRTKSAEQEVDE